MNSLSGKIVLITGGARGIGAATAAYFSSCGAKVMIADRNLAAAQDQASAIGAFAEACDVTNEHAVSDTVDACVDRFGGLDVMVNNAGVIGAVGSLIDTTAEAWRATLAVHLDGVFFGMKHAGRVMRDRRQGSIISLASAAALGGGLGPHAYVAAKAGVITLTRSAAAEFLEFGIRVNAIAPGVVPTPMIGSAVHEPSSPTALSLVSAHDVAKAIGYLASDASNGVTGQTLPIDGGLLATGGRANRFHGAHAKYVGEA